MWKSPIMKFYIAFIKLIFVSKRSKLSERKDVMNINMLLLAILFWSKYFYKRTYICLCFCVHKYTCRISLESIIISYPSHSECLKFYYKWWFLPVFFINTYTLGSFCIKSRGVLHFGNFLMIWNYIQKCYFRISKGSFSQFYHHINFSHLGIYSICG